MNHQKLQEANKINEEISKLEQIQLFFLKEAEKKSPSNVEFLSNYLLNCKNVGDGKTRDHLSKVMLDAAVHDLSIRLDELNQRFEKL